MKESMYVNSNAEFALTVDSMDNVVAFGTIIEINVDATDQTIRGVPLGKENARVFSTKVVVLDALLPIPVKDEIMTVKDALGGTFIAWSRSLISNAVTKKVIQDPFPICEMFYLN